MNRISFVRLLVLLTIAAGTIPAFSQTAEIRKLAPGESIEREMTGAETHRYEVTLKTNEFFQVRVEQKGVDVALKLIDSGGQTLATMDSPNGKEGPETLSFIAEKTGDFILEISSSAPKSAKGTYILERTAPRPATTADQRRVESEQLFIEAIAASATKDQRERAIAKLTGALNGWREVKEYYLQMLTEKQIERLKSAVATKNVSDLSELTMDETIERPIRSGETHAYTVELKNDNFLRIDVVEKGIDITIALKRVTDKNPIAFADFGFGFDREVLSVVIDGNDVYEILVSTGPGNLAGHYALRTKNEGSPSSHNIEQINAERLLAQGLKLRNERKADKLNASIRVFEELMLIWRTLNESYWAGFTASLIAGVHNSLGQNEKALAFLDQAMSLFKLCDDKSGEATVVAGIGSTYQVLGQKQKALYFLNEAVRLQRLLEDKDGEARTLNNIGLVYLGLGEIKSALDSFDLALPLRIIAGDKLGVANTLSNAGLAYYKLGDNRTAFNLYREALAIRTLFNDSHGQAASLNNIAFIYNSQGDLEKALKFLFASLELRRTAGDKEGEAATLNGLGLVYGRAGEKSKALDYFQQAVRLRRFVGDKSGEATTFSSLAVIWGGSNPGLASFFGKRALLNVDYLRSNARGLETDTQKQLLRTNRANYEYLAALLIRQNRLSEALQVLNLGRDQQYFDSGDETRKKVEIALTPTEARMSKLYDDAAAKLGAAGEKLSALERLIGKSMPDAGQAAELKRLQADVTSATDEFSAALKTAETEFSKAKDETADAPDARVLQAALSELDRQTGRKTAVVYTITTNDGFSALVVSADSVKAVSSPVKATELDEKSLKLWALLQSDEFDTTVLSKQIYDAVFAPIEKELPKDTTTIMWSLDGNLRYIPMAALWDGKQFLAERYNHVGFTRADSERLTRAVSPKWTGTGFGTSTAQTVEVLGSKIGFSALPGVTAELGEVFRQKESDKGLLAGEVFSDKLFTKASFIEAMKKRRPLVHIASHFSFRPGDEARSFLLLGDGTAFSLSDMKAEKDLFSGVELLTLSACSTAATQPDANGREIDGFAELAQRLGAGAVMATLWPVSDASTPWLMRDFYKTRETGLTKAEALRRAQLALLNGTAETKPLPNATKGTTPKPAIEIVPRGTKRDSGPTRSDRVVIGEEEAPKYTKDPKKPFAHPYFWAPFVLFGNWK